VAVKLFRVIVQNYNSKNSVTSQYIQKRNAFGTRKGHYVCIKFVLMPYIRQKMNVKNSIQNVQQMARHAYTLPNVLST